MRNVHARKDGSGKTPHKMEGLFFLSGGYVRPSEHNKGSSDTAIQMCKPKMFLIRFSGAFGSIVIPESVCFHRLFQRSAAHHH